MKVILATADSQFIHSNLAIRYLKRHSEHIKCEVKIIETTINDDPDSFLNKIVCEDPDMVVFSCYIWNITYLEKVMGSLKKVLPLTIIAAGGPEVAYDPITFLNRSSCDLVMETEGEEVFPELLKAMLKNRSMAKLSVPGLYIKTLNGIIHTGSREPLDFDSVLFPYSEGSMKDFNNRIVYYEAQRGCPFRCSYCLSSIDKRLRKHSVERVKNELDFFIENEVPLVKFVDRTFNADEAFAFEIWSYLKNKKEWFKKNGLNMKTGFHFEVEAGILSKRQVELLCNVDKGLFQIEAGIQSTDPEVLININRIDRFEKAEENLKKISSAGRVHVHADLIVGLPGDDSKKIIKSINDCMKFKPEMLQLGFLKVLKGTPINDVIEDYQIEYRDYPPYEVLKTRDLSYLEISQFKKYEEIMNKYWNSGNFRNSMHYLLTKSESPFLLFTNIHEFYTYEKNIKENLSIIDYYSLLLRFKDKMDTASSEILSELLRFDYVLRNRKGYIPDTLASEKYNSIKAEVTIGGDNSKKLKGIVTGYRIDVLTFYSKGLIVEEETFIFTHLVDKNIYRVRQNKNLSYEVIDSINPN